MAVRKRIWTTRNGESREAWVVDYTDHTGKRCFETFGRKGEAESRAAKIKVELGKGRHVTLDSKVTVADIAENWIRRVEAEGRERSTLAHYRQHLQLHILPHLGRVRLVKLTPERIEAYRDQYLLGKDDSGRGLISRALARKVLVSLKSMLRSAKCGHLADGIRIAVDGRAKRKLEIGRDVPGNAEIKRLFDATAGQPKMRALLLIAAFTGLRQRITRIPLVRRRSQEPRIARAAAGGSLWRHRQSEVEDQPAHHPARFRRADCGLEGMEARLSEERA